MPAHRAPDVAKQHDLDTAVSKQQEQEYNETAPAFPAILETGNKLTGDTMFIDKAVSDHMVPTEYQLCQHVVN